MEAQKFRIKKLDHQEQYAALAHVFAAIKDDGTVRSAYSYFGKLLGYKGRADTALSQIVDLEHPNNRSRSLTYDEFQTIIDGLYELDPKYAVMYENYRLNALYGFEVIDPNAGDSRKSLDELTMQAHIEGADVTRAVAEHYHDKEIDDAELARITREADEVIAVHEQIKREAVRVNREGKEL